MTRHLTVLVICFLACLVVGCARPNKVDRIPSPEVGLYLTVETFNGDVPVSSDFTRIYAHLERNGQSDKKLLLGGEYLSFSQISWTGSQAVSLCLTGGVTVQYFNEVTLSVDGGSVKVHTYLSESC
jgi:hypothetical protein